MAESDPSHPGQLLLRRHLDRPADWTTLSNKRPLTPPAGEFDRNQRAVPAQRLLYQTKII